MYDFHQMIVESYQGWRDESLEYIQKSYRMSEQESEDVYQEFWAWIAARRSEIPDLRLSENTAWYYKRLNWRCLNKMRGDKRYYDRNQNYMADVSWVTNEKEECIYQEKIAIAYELLNRSRRKFGEKCRLLFQRYYVEGYTVEKIATEQGKAKQSIKNDLGNCRKALKKILQETWDIQ